jgi:DNA-binding MarR family transcriptional regulator
VTATLPGLLSTALDEAVRGVHGEVVRHHPELRPAHLRLLGAGDLDGLRVTSLAARAGMTKQAVHELVVHLERLGYLRREVDPADQRVRRITVTDRGRAVEAELAAAVDRLHERWRHALGAELFQALWTALATIAGPAGNPASGGQDLV